jgi:hypothetical protein
MMLGGYYDTLKFLRMVHSKVSRCKLGLVSAYIFGGYWEKGFTLRL